jgi:putative chitinase
MQSYPDCMINVNQLSLALNISLGRASVWVNALNAAMALHDISTPLRRAAFLAQLCHESNHLGTLSENLNYTPDALMRVFNTPSRIRFTPQLADRYGRTKDHPADQRMIASIAYANRMGNGPAETFDGWTYRGRGPIQLTGKDNMRRCGKAINVDLLSRPELLEKPEAGSMAAAWFWVEGNGTANLNVLADAGNIDRISDIINIGRPTAAYGDANGFNDRQALNESIFKVLA